MTDHVNRSYADFKDYVETADGCSSLTDSWAQKVAGWTREVESLKKDNKEDFNINKIEGTPILKLAMVRR